MSTFPFRNEEYSVEEISYDDMMSILDSQKHISSDITLEMSDTNASNDTHTLTEPVSKQDEFSQRIAENANQQLPEWLLNN